MDLKLVPFGVPGTRGVNRFGGKRIASRGPLEFPRRVVEEINAV